MTEGEWLACTDPKPMLEQVLDDGSPRKLRLFALSCCRRIWDLLQDARSRDLVEFVERVVDLRRRRRIDGCSRHAAYEGSHDAAWARNTEDTGRALKSAAYAAWQTSTSDRYDCDPTYAAYCDAGLAAYDEIIANGPITAPHGVRWEKERQDQSFLLRDIFGNPFRPSPSLPPSIVTWNDDTVFRIAQGIYDERKMPEGTLDNSRLAMLHDALIDAGCDNEELLMHLRSDGPHVRGCWPVDLILGKE